MPNAAQRDGCKMVRRGQENNAPLPITAGAQGPLTKAQIADRKNGKRKAPEEPVEAKKPPMKVARDASVRGVKPTPGSGRAPAGSGKKPTPLPLGRASTAPVLSKETPKSGKAFGAGSSEAPPSSNSAALAEAMADNEQLTMQNEKLNKKINKLETTLDGVKAELEAARGETAVEAAARSHAEGELEKLRKQLAAAEKSLAAAAEREEGLISDKKSLEETVKEREGDIDFLAIRGREQEALRRKMHETISELKGNIRVFCRVRPSLANESASLVKVPTGMLEPTNIELSADGAGSKKQNNFKFDRVFGEGTSQEDIFREVAQLTQSALDGYKVCIFAYGQTGSGKTFTMEGAKGELRGVVPRAAEQVFQSAEDLSRLGWSFEFHASCLEISNEEIRDLLPAEGGATPKGKGKAADNKLKISDANGVVVVPGLRAAKVEDAEGLASLLQGAVKVRATAATKCNEHSSRSHYVFRMAIKGRNGTTNESIDGELNLIDLAGSERTKESGVTGAAMTEANAINKSLSSLGDVISAMGSRSKGSHIPYRNSKLTHMLQNALSGSAKTLMFVNVNPTAHQESLSSLRFAAKVGGVEVGPAAQAKKKGD